MLKYPSHPHNTAPQKVLSLALLSTVLLSSISLTCSAKRENTVISGPGFKIERKKGWFGTYKNTYSDALGNNYSKSKGLFGRTRSDHNLFGGHVVSKGQNTTVTGLNGKPYVTTKRSWFKGKQTNIDTNAMIEDAKKALP